MYSVFLQLKPILVCLVFVPFFIQAPKAVSDDSYFSEINSKIIHFETKKERIVSDFMSSKLHIFSADILRGSSFEKAVNSYNRLSDSLKSCSNAFIDPQSLEPKQLKKISKDIKMNAQFFLSRKLQDNGLTIDVLKKVLEDIQKSVTYEQMNKVLDLISEVKVKIEKINELIKEAQGCWTSALSSSEAAQRTEIINQEYLDRVFIRSSARKRSSSITANTEFSCCENAMRAAIMSEEASSFDAINKSFKTEFSCCENAIRAALISEEASSFDVINKNFKNEKEEIGIDKPIIESQPELNVTEKLNKKRLSRGVIFGCIACLGAGSLYIYKRYIKNFKDSEAKEGVFEPFQKKIQSAFGRLKNFSQKVGLKRCAVFFTAK